MIKRPNYIEKLENLKDLHIIKALTGVRRCGKSTILQMYQQQLLSAGVTDRQIQYLNLEDLDNEEFLNYKKLHDYVVGNLVVDAKNYIFLDEIQLVPGFEKALDSLFIKDNVDLYVTGSNAHMLSGELATLLSGRYIEIHVMPLSFREYYADQEEERAAAFFRYLEQGGFPLTTQITDSRTYKDYVDGIVNTVLIKDVLSRKQRSDSVLVNRLAKFLMDVAGNLVTIKKVADSLTSLGQKTTSETVLSYIQAFQDAFLFYKCDRFDVSGKKYLSVNSKFYPVDFGLRRALLGTKRPNMGSRLETIVFLELVRRGYEVYVGQMGALEIDFVAKRDGIVEYYQVSLSVENTATYEREMNSLKAVQDNYRKILLTQDIGSYNDEGIEQINVIDWLLA